MLRRCSPFRPVALALGAAALVSGCAPKAGIVRKQHAWLRDEAGTLGLAPSTPYTPVFDDAVPDDREAARSARSRIADNAGLAVGGGQIVVAGERFRMDCSGVARGIYARAGVPIGSVEVDGQQNDTRVLFEIARAHGSLRRSDPLPGDLVFFDDTWDQNGNGLIDDPLSHVGVVERVETDGTVVLVHRIGNSVVRARMNLEHPHDRHAADGRALNHYLKTARGNEPAKTAAELFVAFGSLPVGEPSRLASR